MKINELFPIQYVNNKEELNVEGFYVESFDPSISVIEDMGLIMEQMILGYPFLFKLTDYVDINKVTTLNVDTFKEVSRTIKINESFHPELQTKEIRLALAQQEDNEFVAAYITF